MNRDRILASLAKLISEKSTYGAYANEVNSHFSNMDTQLSQACPTPAATNNLIRREGRNFLLNL